MRDAEQSLATDRTVSVQFPDRLHVPDIREAFLRQRSRVALGARHRVGLAGLGAAPEWVTYTRDTAIQISRNLEPIVAVVAPIHDATCDLPPDAEPRGSILHSQRSGKTRWVAVRKVEAGQHRLFLARKPTKNVRDLGHRPVAG